jgi:hypothetical protein
MIRPHFIVSLIVTTILFLPSNARAQWAALNAINLDVRGSAIRAQVANETRRSIANNTKPISKASDSKSLSYRLSLAVRKRNLAQFVEKSRSTNPVGAAQMEQLFASTDVMGQIDKAMASEGLRSNNVADAYAVYWTNAWLGVRGRNEDLPKAQMIMVRNQAANALLATSQFRAATDAQKQELAEAMLIQAALISASIDQAKSDPTLMAKLKVAIAQGAKGMGLDLDKMTLTSQGFRPIK